MQFQVSLWLSFIPYYGDAWILFVLVFALSLYFLLGTHCQEQVVPVVALFSIPLPYIAGELGWVVAKWDDSPDNTGPDACIGCSIKYKSRVGDCNFHLVCSIVTALLVARYP